MVENLLVRFLFSIEGFVVTILLILYIFRDKKTDRIPSTLQYDYEGAASNPKLDDQINRNAYFHTFAPSYRGAMYGLHNDRRKKGNN
jgi:hypothetical protein